MNINFGDISLQEFLSHYWQQKPLLIKGGLIQAVDNRFNEPLTADELAGLAAEESVESRLIYRKENKWHTESGPFEDYSHLGEDDWSLLVQSANHWSDPVQAMLENFSFIPQWRFDDVMISFATKGGGVGPHVDNYDVFICQGIGNRHWRVGFKDDYKIKMASETLMHVEPFKASIDAVLESGDILYIPPGFAHEGLSLNQSMSYSIGYQSTTVNSLFSSFADYLIDFNERPKLLEDSKRALNDYGQVSKSDIQLIKNLLLDTINDDKKLHQFIGQHYTESAHELDIASYDYSADEWLEIFSENPLRRLNGLKVVYLDDNINDDYLYVDGETQHLKKVSTKTIKAIANQQTIFIEDIVADIKNAELIAMLVEYTNRGYWFFDE